MIPLSKALQVSVSELLTGEDKKKEEEVNSIIAYVEMNRKGKYNFPFKVSLVCYVISILIFLFYLKLDYSESMHLHYLVRLLFVVISSFFVGVGNYIYTNNYVETLQDKNRVKKTSLCIIFIYYSILLFNMAIFARRGKVDAYNIIPFRSILKILSSGSFESIAINIVGNFLVFIPIEYFLIELMNVKDWKQNVVISFLLVLFLEMIQYIFKIGVLDVDDILLCLSGMMGFYLIDRHLNKKKQRSS